MLILVTGAAAMLHRAARQADVTRFVFASSCGVYGHSDQVFDEDSPLRPLSLYAETATRLSRNGE